MNTNKDIQALSDEQRSKRIASVMATLKQDYSPDCMKMATAYEYVVDAVGQLVDAGLLATRQPAPAVSQQGGDDAFAAFCDREGYPSDGPFDTALRKAFDAGRAAVAQRAASKDSGRDAEIARLRSELILAESSIASMSDSIESMAYQLNEKD